MVKQLDLSRMRSLIAGLRDRLRQPGRMDRRSRRHLPKLDAVPIANAEQFVRYLNDHRDEFANRQDRMTRMNQPVERIETGGS